MGSLIHLGIGRLEVDWGKNSIGRDHSALFLPNDIRQTPYFYADGISELKPAYVRPLRSVVRRLELLGFTLSHCQHEFDDLNSAWPDYLDPVELSFDDLASAMKAVDVWAVNLAEDGDYDLGEYVHKAIAADPHFAEAAPAFHALSRDEGVFFENLDPYVVLRLLAENPRNLEHDVVWRYADVLEGGYVAEDEVYAGVSESDRCLLVTEGSSDGVILRESLPVVAPDIADFFTFVDMTENYPFTGTGNLFRFCQGLARIRIQNRILVLLDNDVSGRAARKRIEALDLPRRMAVAQLPDLGDCRAVETLGPTGTSHEDINGRATSIECFLDIWRDANRRPQVRWTAYDKELNAYQGELVGKESHVRKFLEAVRRGASYDFTRLEMLWQHIVDVLAGRTSVHPS